MPNIIAPLYRNGLPACIIRTSNFPNTHPHFLGLSLQEMAELAWRVKKAELSYDIAFDIEVGDTQFQASYSNVVEIDRAFTNSNSAISNNETDVIFGTESGLSRPVPRFWVDDTKSILDGVTITENGNTTYDTLNILVAGTLDPVTDSVGRIPHDGENLYYPAIAFSIQDSIITHSTNPGDFIAPVQTGFFTYRNSSCPMYTDSDLYDSGSVSANIVFLPIEFYTFGNTVSNTTGYPESENIMDFSSQNSMLIPLL